MKEIRLHRDSPGKPAVGAACNGCGVCCALEPCPPAWLFVAAGAGPCAALEWRDAEQRYRCGLVANPGRYVPWLPRRLHAWAGLRFARRIAAGKGCDCDASEIG